MVVWPHEVYDYIQAIGLKSVNSKHSGCEIAKLLERIGRILRGEMFLVAVAGV